MSRLLAICVAVFLGWVGPAAASGPLVDIGWVKANLGNPGLRFLDLRSGARKTKADYLKGHIPGAVFTDYAKDGWREKSAGGVQGMMPAPEKLERLIGSLGIDNQTHVVLIPEGRSAQDVGAATRVYWTMKVLGHDLVSILDGGYTAWAAEVGKDKKPLNPIETADQKPAAKVFKAKVRKDWMVVKADVEKAMADKEPLVDSRPQDFYLGLTKSPAAKRAGTLPGAISLPESWLTQNNGGKFRPRKQLAQLYQVAGVPVSGKQINFCNTGHWASLSWFVAHEILGNKEARMYDGSLAEWTQDPRAPVDQKVKVD
jgi:thiosulfate/3-mercaptopyruvate sulfurtransferase